MRVATTMLSPAEMGRISLVMTTVSFFAMFLINPVGMFINRRLHAWKQSGVAACYLKNYIGYLLMTSMIASVGVVAICISGAVDFGLSLTWLIVIVCGSLLFNTLNQTAIPSLNLLGNSLTFVLLSLATMTASFAGALALAKIVQPAAQYWMLGLIIGQAVIGVVGAEILFRNIQPKAQVYKNPKIQVGHLQVLFNFAWPIAISAGLGWVQGQGYRFVIHGHLGLAQLGLFAAGYGISAGMISAFESVVTTYFQPRLYRDVCIQDADGHARAWHRYAAAVIPSLILTVALVIILAPELTHVLVGEKFQSASEYVLWGALAEAARVLMGIYSLIAHVLMRTRWLVVPSIVGAALSITLVIIFVPTLGAAGAGLGLVLAGFAVVATMHGSLARHVGGGPSMRPVALASAAAALMWGMTIGTRAVFGTWGWYYIGGVMALVGSTYLIFQYLFLRQHFTDGGRT